MSDTVEDCYCTDEGPCEQHLEMLVTREGASTRTADELLTVFVEDAMSVGVELSPWGRDVLERANALLDANRSMGVAWLPEDDGGVRDELDTLQHQVEAELSGLGLSSWWDDGYVIGRVTGGPLADDADGEEQ